MALPSVDLPSLGWFLLTGACAGFLSGLLSIGGALVMVPAFLAIFRAAYGLDDKFMVQLALGTTMACMVVNALCSTVAQNRKRCVVWDVPAQCWPHLCLGTAAGVWLTSSLDAALIKGGFGAYCLYSGYRMVFRPGIGPVAAAQRSLSRGVVLLFGVVCGLVGTGGANLFVPYLMRARGLDLRQAMGSAAALQIPVSVVGAASFLLLGLHESAATGPLVRSLHTTGATATAGALGYVFVPGLLLVCVAAPYFNRAGVGLAHLLPVPRLKWAFGLFTFLVGARMVYAAFWP